MNEQVTKSLCQEAEWYDGLTIAERIHGLRNVGFASPVNTTVAERRLAKWKTGAPFSRQRCFDERLAQDAVTEEEFRGVLGTQPESLRKAIEAPPVWLLDLEEAWSRQSDSCADSITQSVDRLLSVAGPLLGWGRRRLADAIDQLQQEHQHAVFPASQVIESCLGTLGLQLAPMVMRTLVLELNAARLRGQLQGDTGEARFESFGRRLADDSASLSILREYPVLARLVVLRVDFTVRYSVEFLERLCCDWGKILSLFPGAAEAGSLVSFMSGVGDMHHRGRSVGIASFQSGFKLVYKPHSLAVDAHYQELLDWCSQRGFEAPLSPLRILDCCSHGWSEFAADEACTSISAVKHFYFRLGGQMALMYILNANDFHHENILASGEHPVLVDLETLFHPVIPTSPEMRATRFVQHTIGDSVLRTHLLPQQTWINQDLEGVDISGISAREGQTLPFLVFQPEAAGTDEMRFVKQKTSLPTSRNRPRLGETKINPLDYTEQIEGGFTSMYRMLAQNRAELVSDAGPVMAFLNDPVRVIVRPTNTYERIYSESFHPAYLRNGIDRERLIDKLWLGIDRQPWLKATIPYERRDLQRGDIPCFSTTPSCPHLHASDGECLKNFFTEPAINVVRRRLEDMNESRLEKQLDLIRCSMATLEDHSVRPLTKSASTDSSGQGASSPRKRLMETARRVGDRLIDLAWSTPERDLTTWVGLVSFAEKSWSVMPSGLDLYNGLPGPALFLGWLGAMTGERRYTDTARAAINMLCQQASELSAGFPDLKSTIGAFGGASGVIYVLGQLGCLWSDSELLQKAEQQTPLLHKGIPEDKAFDIISGAAGCICAMDAFYALTNSDAALRVARSCGDFLLEKASPLEHGLGWKNSIEASHPLTGFSHGAAGIAYALFRLSHRTGDDRYRQTALAAIEYERSHFMPAENNWPDWRVRPGDTPETPVRCMVAWCHGAPGIGLARVAALRWHEDAITLDEVDAAVRATVAGGFGSTHSLCHGDLGNLELLLLCAQSRSRSAAFCQEHLNRLTAEILDAIAQNGWLCATPRYLESPGLMVGIAGIGYALLRLAHPDQVPSVLLLESTR